MRFRLNQIIKALFILVMIALIQRSSIGQDKDFEPSFLPSFEYSIGKLDNVLLNQFSINFEARLHKNFGLNWNFDYVRGSNDYQEIHIPGGSIIIFLIPPVIYAGPGALLIALLPEGVSGHFKINEKIDLSPYANVLGLDFHRNWNWPKHAIDYHYSFGVKTTFNVDNKYAIGVFSEMRKTGSKNFSYRIGMSIGLS